MKWSLVLVLHVVVSALALQADMRVAAGIMLEVAAVHMCSL